MSKKLAVIEHDFRLFFSQEELEALIQGFHANPHQLLGLQQRGSEKMLFLWRPGAEKVHFELFGQIVEADRIDERGMFAYRVPEKTTRQDYRVYHMNQLLDYDPYSFPPTVGELDAYLLNQGVHYELYNIMGAHFSHHGCAGVQFALWCPGAKSVSLVGDFNYWNGTTNPMRSLGSCGVWEIFIPGLQEGEKYKFEVKSGSGEVLLKTDPFATCMEVRPKNGSVVFDVTSHSWKDQEWMQKRKEKWMQSQPMNIYELHLGSWRKKGKEFPNYREIAVELAQYCQEMGFTHVELMPLLEHPLDESWGYQVIGFYAVTSRYGTPRDFQYFVDTLHQHNVGVIMDWVPAHFPTDSCGLSCFDGTYLYEHQDPRLREHPHWQTSIFNYGRKEVANFLIANALYWFDKMHIDGLRVDAVASMLYLDYGRKEGEWIPNQYGGKENLEAIDFLKHVNSIVRHRFPDVYMIAEESTAFTGVTHPLEQGGLGFHMKWNMGWMNDTLEYFCKDPIYRSYHHNHLTFGLLYAFSERFALVLSHDEVVHGKRSLLSKMPGDSWQKMANLRLLYSYMVCQPGKNLLFMGGELGQWDEWNCKKELDWILLDFPVHCGIQQFVKAMNHFSLRNPALWENDFDGKGFEWIDFADRTNSVISYKRKAEKQELICVHNFTPTTIDSYRIYLSGLKSIREVLNSDDVIYGGSGKTNPQIEVISNEQGNPIAFEVTLSPLATLILEPELYTASS